MFVTTNNLRDGDKVVTVTKKNDDEDDEDDEDDKNEGFIRYTRISQIIFN